MNEDIKQELLSMQQRDLDFRDAIVKEGGLYDGYDEGMESIHLENADRLNNIIKRHGWPGYSLVGEDGARAAFLVAQHAISNPPLQRSFLEALSTAVTNGDAAEMQRACLQDRILFNEGKPQKCGFLFDWNDAGELFAWVDDFDQANERRKKLGLDRTIEEAAAAHRIEIDKEGGPPKDIKLHRQMAVDWAIKVGWRSATGTD